ncbi:hypothetical protein [Catellatospora chokoriensis]|uniref:ElaB/YqjD/DUF883 family membrane-anchored ribosome-binding protein n=1 Tax=Catellatospora chokoriensis TaxID=310353 RepID=A0A8J3JXI5_9ACTN|nr:hypothetical protein [Catellatospora chokoriensis]GIF88951.1 hypothetical protein Cch02nite_23950 [Catellatospora chokoriensis]
MPSKDDALSGAQDALDTASAAVAEKAAEAKQAAIDTGHALAAGAGELKVNVGHTAVAAKDAATEALSAVNERIPHTADEWEAAGRDLLASIRRNPTPWAAGAAVFLVGWLLGRNSSGSRK